MSASFERDGQYQLYIEDMQPDGAGALSIAFEQLKKKARSGGLVFSGEKAPDTALSMSCRNYNLAHGCRGQGYNKRHNAPQPVNADYHLSRSGSGRVGGGSDIGRDKTLQCGALRRCAHSRARRRLG